MQVLIGAVRLLRRGGEEDPEARAVVEVEVRGNWVEVLSEPLSSNFCSGVNAGVIAHRSGIPEEKPKTNEEIVADCNELARLFYGAMGYVVPAGYRFDKATHPQERGCWDQAAIAFEQIEGTDVEQVLMELEDEGG